MITYPRLTAWVCLLLLCGLFCAPALALTVSVPYAASDAELVNPFIGNAVWANDTSDHPQPFTLVYASIIWADFEPEPGQYDFASFEQKNQFARWRAEGKRVILRFMLDVPSAKRHRDIPDWLYQAIDKDGTVYSIPYGRGFSPNYANPALILAHAEAVAALGARYGNDPFIAYVQLGSVGHWGEWHVHEDIGHLPSETVLNQYVFPYIQAFPHTFLLMRRPFPIAAKYGLGLFNDSAGDLKSTETWLNWIANGGEYGTDEGAEELVPMANAWQTAPIGGELSTRLNREDQLLETLDQTLMLFERSHASWIGPGSFADIPRDCALQAALHTLNRRIGYRLRVSRCTVQENDHGEPQVILLWENDGIAPFYFDWQPTLALVDTDGTQTLLPLALSLIELLPERPVAVTITLPRSADPRTLWVGIIDPETGEPGVALAMQAPRNGLWYELITLQP